MENANSEVSKSPSSLKLDGESQRKLEILRASFSNAIKFEVRTGNAYFMGHFWGNCLEAVYDYMGKAKLNWYAAKTEDLWQPALPDVWEQDMRFLINEIFQPAAEHLEKPAGYRVRSREFGDPHLDGEEVRKLVSQEIKKVLAAEKAGIGLPWSVAAEMEQMTNSKSIDRSFLRYAFLFEMQKKWEQVKGTEQEWSWAWVAAPMVAYLKQFFGERLR